MSQLWATAWRVEYLSDTDGLVVIDASAVEVADGGALLVFTTTRPTAPREGVPDLILGPGTWRKVERGEPAPVPDPRR